MDKVYYNGIEEVPNVVGSSLGGDYRSMYEVLVAKFNVVRDLVHDDYEDLIPVYGLKVYSSHSALAGIIMHS